MDNAEAKKIIETEIAPVFELLMYRQGSSLSELNTILLNTEAIILKLPNEINWPDDFEPILDYKTVCRRINLEWPELDFYDDLDGSGFTETTPEFIGYALDDLSDIVLEIGRTLEMAEVSAVGALSQLRFGYVGHLDAHFEGLRKYLNRKIG